MSEDAASLPKECKSCKRDQCPLHCAYLSDRVKALGKKELGGHTEGGAAAKMSGTY